MEKFRRFSTETDSARVIRLSSKSRSNLLSGQTKQQPNDPETFLACVFESMAEYDEALQGLIER